MAPTPDPEPRQCRDSGREVGNGYGYGPAEIMLKKMVHCFLDCGLALAEAVGVLLDTQESGGNSGAALRDGRRGDVPLLPEHLGLCAGAAAEVLRDTQKTEGHPSGAVWSSSPVSSQRR